MADIAVVDSHRPPLLILSTTTSFPPPANSDGKPVLSLTTPLKVTPEVPNFLSVNDKHGSIDMPRLNPVTEHDLPK